MFVWVVVVEVSDVADELWVLEDEELCVMDEDELCVLDDDELWVLEDEELSLLEDEELCELEVVVLDGVVVLSSSELEPVVIKVVVSPLDSRLLVEVVLSELGSLVSEEEDSVSVLGSLVSVEEVPGPVVIVELVFSVLCSSVDVVFVPVPRVLVELVFPVL